MRFHENGPNIPDELILAQRRGQVVFFCGAGISVPAKLPSFLGLARDVMRTFGVSKTSSLTLGTQLEQIEEVINASENKKIKLPFSLDQTFYLLQQEYGRAAVVQEVLSAVTVTKSAPVDGHKDILRLSRNRGGDPQVVTTNFDLLFQQADSRIKSYVPPVLPSLTNGEQINGVVYLHGKWNDAESNSQAANNLIISSADFGRAYLADGWASTFIKDLAQQYVIVLLGYSAEDPPVRYLLEGLHASGVTVKPRIYSFERGSAEEVRQNWQHRGVTGIAFDAFTALWGSLKEWALYAEDPRGWQRLAIDMARQPPSALKSYQRGQVAFTISTVEGAKMFAEATPPPPAEWLCVFDPLVRNQKPSKCHISDELYSFQERYALDDDVYLAEDSEEIEISGNDYLCELSGDERKHTSIGLAKSHVTLPVRLEYLAAWFVQVLEQPISLWWLVGKANQSSQLRRMIENRLRRPDSIENEQLDAWYSYFEQVESEVRNFDARLFRFRDAIKIQGWSPRMIRTFEDALKPLIDVARYNNFPPVDRNKSVLITIRLPEMSGLEIDVPDENLADVLRVYRFCIEKYVALTKDYKFFFYPDFLDEADRNPNPELYSYVQWFKNLFARLAHCNPSDACKEVNSWSLNDLIFFAPLRLHAWMQTKIWQPRAVLDGILALPAVFLWRSRKYVAPLVGAYWVRFSNPEKRKLLNLFKKGPSEDIGYSADASLLNEVGFIAPFLMELQAAGCELDTDCKNIIQRAQDSEHWVPLSERNDYSPLKVMRRVVNTQHDSLLVVPISEIVKIAEDKKNHRNYALSIYEPFEGLVRNKVIRAYRALVFAMKNDSYPIALWADLFNSIPDATSHRLYLCMLERAFRMPANVLSELSQAFSSFLEKSLLAIATYDYPMAISIWDRAFSKFLSIANIKNSTQDSGNYGLRGRIINDPLGIILKLLIQIYPDVSMKKDRRAKIEFLGRLNFALAASTESRKFLINIGISELCWFNLRFPKWTKENLVVRLRSNDNDHEAAWNGFMYLGYVMPPNLFAMIKQDFLQIFGQFSKWPWGKDLSKTLHGHYLQYCSGLAKEGKYLTGTEAREILQRTDDNGRVSVLYRLSEGGNWLGFQRKFLKKIWPRELKYMNSRVSSVFIKIAIENEENFSDAVSTILPFMTYVTHADQSFYSLRGDVLQIAERHPSKMLSLINAAIGDETVSATPHIASLLNKIEEVSPELGSDARLRRIREFLDHHPY
jgi:hypothetical protein